jgi:hypothetical protein
LGVILAPKNSLSFFSTSLAFFMNFSLCSDSDLELPWGFVPQSSHYFSVPNFPTRFDCCATGLNGNSFITSQTLVVVDCPFTFPFSRAEVILQCYRTGFRHLEMIGGPHHRNTIPPSHNSTLYISFSQRSPTFYGVSILNYCFCLFCECLFLGRVGFSHSSFFSQLGLITLGRR